MIVVGVLMYNFFVFSQLKVWMDRIVQSGKIFSYILVGFVGFVGGKKVIIVLVWGGFYVGMGLEDMDFQEQFLCKFLGFLGILCVEFVCVEGVLKGEDVKFREIFCVLFLILQVINVIFVVKE